MATAGLAPRRGALRLLDGVLGHKRPMSELTAKDGKAMTGLGPADRARAGRLALTTLRHIEQADRLLRPYLRRLPPLPVLNVLRLAVVEIAVTGAAPHGVVSAAVDLVRADSKTARLSGLVNAVLRKAGANAPARWPDLPPPGLPRWLRSPLEDAWGAAAVHAIETAHTKGAPVDLTPGPAMTDALVAQLGGGLLPTGSLRLTAPGQISALPGYDDGAWWVQDAAAAIPARALAARAGERVLDLCAAPGGKTLQLAATGAEVAALDISPVRMTRLRENLERTGLTATLIEADALDWRPDAPFDAILLDAPCSATGTIRRHPDLLLVRDGSELEGLIGLQARLIDQAAGWLKPGGRLVFATCSLLPDEGEHQARAALRRIPGLWPQKKALKLDGIDADWIGEHGLRLRPDYWPTVGGMDGFFVAAFQRD